MRGDFGPWGRWAVGFEAVGEGLAFGGGEERGLGREDVNATTLGAVGAEEDIRRGDAFDIDEAQEGRLRVFGVGAGAGADGSVGHEMVLHF